MEPEKDPNQPAAPETASVEQPATPEAVVPETAPADALSMTPEELEQEAAANPAPATAGPEDKKLSPLKRIFRVVNVYFLLFLLLVVVAGAIAAVNYLNSEKPQPEASIVNQKLTADTLKQLANTDASVGGTSQTLTIQGNAIIDGSTLARGNLSIAGNVQTGGSLNAPSLTISGNVNLGATQANSLQVAQNLAVQGTTTLRNLNVSGTSTFNGAMTASQISVTNLILSGNASLNVPNHIRFSGATPIRVINQTTLGGGGSVSVNGSDTSGTININSGNSPTAGCFATITFNQRFTNKPHVIVSPVEKAAGQLQYYVTRDNNSFSICTANAAAAHQSFAFDYFVTN